MDASHELNVVSRDVMHGMGEWSKKGKWTSRESPASIGQAVEKRQRSPRLARVNDIIHAIRRFLYIREELVY